MDLFYPHLKTALTKGPPFGASAFPVCTGGAADPLYLFKSLTEPRLEGCGSGRIGQIVDAIDSMDSLSTEVATLQTMLSSAQEMKLDSEGRIMLSAGFVPLPSCRGWSHAGIGRSFQIWLPDRYRIK